MNKQLTFSMVVDADGIILVEESVAAAHAAIVEYKSRKETEEGDIALAVELYFSENKGATINIKAIVSYALTALKVVPGAWVDMEKRVRAYLVENTDHPEDDEKQTPAEPPRTRIFGRKGGPRGGLFRWSDIPA